MISARLPVSIEHIGTSFTQTFINEKYILGYEYRDKTQELIEVVDYWRSVNLELEQLIESNECYEVNRINYESCNRVFFDKFRVNRPYI